tara:strand:+ start:60 stop:536 length:477 start_codon:yes stop_codon:yes gene_type:complete
MDLSEKIIDKKEELLNEFENLSLEEVAKKIKEIEKRDDDVVFKIAYLAARISVLNKRIQELINENAVNDNSIKETIDDSSNIVEKIIKKSKKSKDLPVEWVRVQIKETTEVNGVRFPSGIQIDVTDEDAKQMIESDKAILLEDVESKAENDAENKVSE